MAGGFHVALNNLQLAVIKYVEASAALHESDGAQSETDTDDIYCDINLAEEENQRLIEWTSSQLSHVHFALKRARNRSTLPSRLPSELLVEIFLLDTSEAAGPVLSTRAQRAVRRAVSLSGVCSYWRSLITKTASFWTQVPLAQSEGSGQITSLCLERSQTRLIDISTALFGWAGWRGGSVLVKHTQRIRSLTISAYAVGHIHSIMECVLHAGVPRHLKDLSVQFQGLSDPSYSTRIFPDPPHTSSMDNFKNLIKGLDTMDLGGIGVDWSHSTFDNLQVLTLRRGVLIGESSSPHILEDVAASCPKLSTLELIDCPLPIVFPGVAQCSSLGSVKTLCIRYPGFPLFCKTLGSISPEQYDIQLSLYSHFLPTQSSRLHPTQEIQLLVRFLLKFPNITALELKIKEVEETREWLPRALWALGNVHTICLGGFSNHPILTREFLSIITRPQDTDSPDEANRPYPSFRTIQMQGVVITDQEAFKAMITSHPVQLLELKGCFILPHDENSKSGDVVSPARISTSSPFYQWLSENVPKLSFRSSTTS